MTTLQANAEIFRSLSIIAEDENLMKRAGKYLKKLADQKQEADDSLLSEEEFMAKIDRSLEQAKRGEITRMLPHESLDDLLKRTGYDL